MKTVIRALVIGVLFYLTPATYAKELPFELFAKHSQFRQLVISPTGEYLAASFLKDNGVPTVAVFDLSSMKLLSSLNFERKEQPGNITWLNDNRIGMVLLLQYGTLDFPVNLGDYFSMDVDGSKKANLWGFRNKGGTAINPTLSGMEILHLLPGDPKHILVAEHIASRKQQTYSKAYKLNVYTGKTQKVASSPIKGGSFLADRNANIRFVSGIDPDENNRLKIYYREHTSDAWTLSKSYDVRNGKFVPIAFTEDGQQVYAMGDLENSVLGLLKLDLKSGEFESIYRHDRVDPDDVIFSENHEVVGLRISPDYSYNKIISDHPMGKLLKSIQAAFPNQTTDITSMTKDQSKLIVRVSSDKNPGKYYLFDIKIGSMKFVASARPWIDEKAMASVSPFSLVARDGTNMYGYLTLPKGGTKDLPLVVYPHGGPHGVRDHWRFDSDAQLLANRGYAVLQLNFRGSGGYGREFMYAGYGKWGAEMQDDITDATRWAIQQGIADKDRICIYGASYGGYASLMAVTKEPDLYQCAVGYVGVYSLPMMFEKGDIPNKQTGINFLKEALGEDEDLLLKRSPAYNVDKIKAALFLVHGGKDPRVPIEQAELLKDALDKKGHPYEWMVKEKEAHGFYDVENRTELYERLVSFLDKHIGKKAHAQ